MSSIVPEYVVPLEVFNFGPMTSIFLPSSKYVDPDNSLEISPLKPLRELSAIYATTLNSVLVQAEAFANCKNNDLHDDHSLDRVR